LLPWAAELNCRCNAEPQNLAHPASSTALLALQQGTSGVKHGAGKITNN